MAIIWTVDARIDAARKHPGWPAFHRECGKLNFYIENIERQGRGYIATSFRLRDRMAPPYVTFPMASGSGKTPIDACVDAYRKAVAAAHMPDTNLERLFAEPEDDEDLIGSEPDPVELEEDLIG